MCHSPRCMICDGPVAGSRWVCMDCATRWGLGLSLTEWPAWARLLKRLEQRRRRCEAQEPRWIGLDADGDPPRVRAEPTDALLEYAPYADEAANREYREACGIEERERDVPSDAAADIVSGEGER